MLKIAILLSATLLTTTAHAATRTVVMSAGQSKTLAQPHASGSQCNSGNVQISIVKSPKIGTLSITDKKVKGCNGKRVSYRSGSRGKDSVTIRITLPNGSTSTNKIKIKIK